MRTRWIPLIVLLGCQIPNSHAHVPETSSCPNEVQAELAYLEGSRQLQASRDGEHLREAQWTEALKLLRFAAVNGNTKAQSLMGRPLFVLHYGNQSPVTSERRDYVVAMAALRLAAIAGDVKARGFLPGLATNPVDRSEIPLCEIPEEWIHEALQIAAED